MRLLRTIAINAAVLVVLLVLVELVGGSWFKNDPMASFNIPRTKTVYFDPSILYANGGAQIRYTRDANGLRGSCIATPRDVEVLTLGGSTTDQRYITDTATWQEVLQRAWQAQQVNICIANAGVDGHSTYGHIKGMEEWLLPMQDLAPKYVVFYIGLNDIYLENETVHDHAFKRTVKRNWKQRSILYQALVHWLGRGKQGVNELGHGGANLHNLEYTDKGLLLETELEALLQGKMEAYLQRLEKLIALSEEMGAQPVFISQPSFRYKVLDSLVVGTAAVEEKWEVQCNGVDFYKMHMHMNEVLAQVATRHEAKYIDMSQKGIWLENDFYDFMHMTPQGAEKLGKAIADEWLPK